MDRIERSVDRRGFLKTGLQATAAAAALGAQGRPALASAPSTKAIASDAPIPQRVFGKTGHTFPVLGHGGSAMMAKEYGYYHLDNPPAIEDRVKMVRNAYDKGVRYFDTARIYQESERIMGEGLKGVRDKVYLATKVLVGTPAEARESVETSLKELQTDYIDCVQIHGPSIERLKYDGAMKLHAELVKLRDEGKTRFVGMTGHNAFDEMYKMIATGGFDQVLIEYGYFHKGYNTRHSETTLEWREACIAKAHDLTMGIVAMKVLGAWVFNHNAKNMVEGFGADRIKKLPGAAIRWALRDERISVLNIGVSYPTDIEENLKTLQGNLTFTNDDRLLLAEFSSKAYLHESVQKLPIV